MPIMLLFYFQKKSPSVRCAKGCANRRFASPEGKTFGAQKAVLKIAPEGKSSMRQRHRFTSQKEKVPKTTLRKWYALKNKWVCSRKNVFTIVSLCVAFFFVNKNITCKCFYNCKHVTFTFGVRVSFVNGAILVLLKTPPSVSPKGTPSAKLNDDTYPKLCDANTMLF